MIAGRQFAPTTIILKHGRLLKQIFIIQLLGAADIPFTRNGKQPNVIHHFVYSAYAGIRTSISLWVRVQGEPSESLSPGVLQASSTQFRGHATSWRSR